MFACSVEQIIVKLATLGPAKVLIMLLCMMKWLQSCSELAVISHRFVQDHCFTSHPFRAIARLGFTNIVAMNIQRSKNEEMNTWIYFVGRIG